MTKENLKDILDNHQLWLAQKGGKKANLQQAGLWGADLWGANLQGANLQGAYLQEAYLQEANLQGANLQGAYLQEANLQGANLQGAYLRGVNLQEANLQEAYLQGANIPNFQIPRGELRVYKKVEGKIVHLLIPSYARRTACLINRKCRASMAIVLAIQGDMPVTARSNLVYDIGKLVYPDKYDPDPRIDCSHGIHFFLTRKEAEEF